MSDRNDSRLTDADLGRQIKANLRGLDAFVVPAPSFPEIQSSAPRPLRTRGRSTVRLRQNPKAASGLLVAGVLAVVVLGSVVWRPDRSAGAVESPTSSGVASTESGTPVASFDAPTMVASATSTAVPEASFEASAEPTIASEPSPSMMASFDDGVATSASPWYAAELYMLKLVNCTRTGGWVAPDGACGSDKGHTRSAQPALVLDPDISAKVARPYARYMAEHSVLTHGADHDPAWRLCSWGSFCGGPWGENIASPGSATATGMIEVEIFYQNESFFQGVHYANIMDPGFHRVGIGVWKTSSIVRVVIDFYQ